MLFGNAGRRDTKTQLDVDALVALLQGIAQPLDTLGRQTAMLIALRRTVSAPDTKGDRHRVAGAGFADAEMFADGVERAVLDITQPDGFFEGLAFKTRSGRGISMGCLQAELVGLDLQGVDASAR